MNFAIACDIMMDLEGSVRPALYLAESLTEKGYKVSMISPIISMDVERHLNSKGIKPINLRARLFAGKFGLSILWFEAWAREAFLRLNSKGINHNSCVSINFSHTLDFPSTFWYLQGPTSAALKDMEGELTPTYKFVYKILKRFIKYADENLIKSTCKDSVCLVANSNFCASLYGKWKIKIKTIIYPPIDCKVFRPTTSNPANDYVLTYFGKETAFPIIKAIADQGVKIKAFGSKIPFIPKNLTNHPNIDFLGRIPTDQLVDAYSNALFTLFPFTHEPFGYIPVESMACGTPTLTYDSQGPRESVINGVTGWLAKNNNELFHKALELWKEGYCNQMRLECVKRALTFDKTVYAKKWFKILQPYINC